MFMNIRPTPAQPFSYEQSAEAQSLKRKLREAEHRSTAGGPSPALRNRRTTRANRGAR